MNIDWPVTPPWVDIFAHGAIAFTLGALTARAMTAVMAILAAANAAFWFFRELYQHQPDAAAYPFDASLQSNLEWIVPTLTFPLGACACAVVLSALRR